MAFGAEAMKEAATHCAVRQDRAGGAGQGHSPEHGEEGGRLVQRVLQDLGAAPKFMDAFAARHLGERGDSPGHQTERSFSSPCSGSPSTGLRFPS